MSTNNKTTALENQEFVLLAKHFGRQTGERLTVLSFKGSGLYRVRFEDGSTDVLGRSKFLVG